MNPSSSRAVRISGRLSAFKSIGVLRPMANLSVGMWVVLLHRAFSLFWIFGLRLPVSLNCSHCRRVSGRGSDTSMNLGARRCRPMALACAAERFQENVRICRLDLLFHQRQEVFTIAGVVESPQRIENRPPGA